MGALFSETIHASPFFGVDVVVGGDVLRASSVMRFPFADRLGVCCAIGRLRLADRSVDVRATAVFLRLQTASAAVVRNVGCFRDGEVDGCVKQSQQPAALII